MSKVDELFRELSDLQYHCSICLNRDKIKSGQLAKVAQNLRDRGFPMEKNGGIFGKQISCEICKKRTLHYKLLSTERVNEDIARSGIKPELRKKIFDVYGKVDNFTNSSSANLEIDHRCPPRATGDNERKMNSDMSIENIKKNFQLLSKENNNIKREACKKCIETGVRGVYIVNYFYEGTEEYKESCLGCFFAYPEIWKEKIENELYRK